MQSYKTSQVGVRASQVGGIACIVYIYIYIYKGKKGSSLCSCTILFVFENKVG